MKKKLNLQQCISIYGTNEISDAVGMSWDVVNHWTKMTRRPSIDAAWKIIQFTNGACDFNSIFEPYLKDEPTQMEMML